MDRGCTKVCDGVRRLLGKGALMIKKRVLRPRVREGYDLWSETYGKAPNPLVALDKRVYDQPARSAAGRGYPRCGLRNGAQPAGHGAGREQALRA